ncbi:MAG: winged helix-turn-helix transcriptional regulator [Clostridia bacterium]|nr:winged helix-turn-helix transcriptional regulator [Clostridia bacterium]
MTHHVVILSSDCVFARMLELELMLCGLRVFVSNGTSMPTEAPVMLLDLDSVSTDFTGQYQNVIGFTRESALRADEMRRRCTMILHRPFSMQALRREVLSCAGYPVREGENPLLSEELAVPRNGKISPKLQGNSLVLGTKAVALSPKERAVMECLLACSDQPVARQEIAERIGESTANKTEVYICHLRKKIEDTFGVRMILTVRGKGYLLQTKKSQLG